MAHVEFQTAPARYRHWRLTVDDSVATLAMDVDEQGGLVPGYELKLFTDGFPTTATGKIRRVELRSMAATVLRPASPDLTGAV